MSEVRGAIYGAVAVIVGGVVTGLATYFVAQSQAESQVQIAREQGELQLKTIYSKNYFELSKSLRGRSEEFFKSGRKFIYSITVPSFSDGRVVYARDLTADGSALVVSAASMAPYLDYGDILVLQEFLHSVVTLSREVSESGNFTEESAKSISCQFSKVEYIVNRKLAYLDLKTLPDSTLDVERQKLVDSKDTICKDGAA